MINTIENEKLAGYTTFKVGGPARYFVTVKSEAELMEALNFAKEKELPIFVLGGGSNVLISDRGLLGLTVYNQVRGINFHPNGRVEVSGGEKWDDLVRLCIDKNFAGIECLSGVPGTVGGAVVQNIGAYGQTLSDVVEQVKVVEIKTGKVIVFKKEQCEFEYRNSLFKKTDGYFVLSVWLGLIPNGLPEIKYPDLQKRIKTSKPSLKEIRNQVIDARADKGMVIDDCHEVYKSAGSFFKNPVVENNLFEKIKLKLEDPSIDTPWYWPQENGKIKIAAARITRKAGFNKGDVYGNVGISPKQPLAIINLGTAQAKEILNVSHKIQQEVQRKFQIILEPEVKFVGKFD